MLPSRILLAIFSFALVVALSWPASVFSMSPAQSSTDTPEISDPECSFYLDRDKDGEGNERFDAEPDNHIPQETHVVGGCEFKLNAPANVTMVVESDLKEWSGDVELTEEPNDPKEYQVYSGNNEIPNVQGTMVITANFRGNTPRSIKSRTMPDGYQHDVQIPEEFRLMGITVITADGRKDRLERNVQSASLAYIQVRNLMLDPDEERPDWVNSLTDEWLNKGYPQVADSIVVQASAARGGNTGVNYWLWSFIGTWVLIGIATLALGVLYMRNR